MIVFFRSSQYVQGNSWGGRPQLWALAPQTELGCPAAGGNLLEMQTLRPHPGPLSQHLHLTSQHLKLRAAQEHLGRNQALQRDSVMLVVGREPNIRRNRKYAAAVTLHRAFRAGEHQGLSPRSNIALKYIQMLLLAMSLLFKKIRWEERD